jgi:uncharacterized membrane protein
MHLTPIQRERLLNRDKPEFANVKRTNDYLVREALKEFLDLEDVKLILANLPKEQIEKVVTDDQIDQLLTLAEELYNFLGPGDGPYYEVPYEFQPLTAKNNFQPAKKKDVAKVSEADKRRANRLQIHINRLGLKDTEGERGRRNYYYNTYMNLESMASKGMKMAYRKKEGKKEEPPK